MTDLLAELCFHTSHALFDGPDDLRIETTKAGLTELRSCRTADAVLEDMGAGGSRLYGIDVVIWEKLDCTVRLLRGKRVLWLMQRPISGKPVSGRSADAIIVDDLKEFSGQ